VGTLGTVIVVDAVARAARRIATPPRGKPKSAKRKTKGKAVAVRRSTQKEKRELLASLRVGISTKKAQELRKRGMVLPTLAAARKTVAAEKKAAKLQLRK